MIEQKYADLFAKGSQVSLPVAEREIVLTYILNILREAGLLKTLAFKGGTCLRKCVYGSQMRFSEDLDFTSVGSAKADDVIISIVDALGPSAYGIEFDVDTKDFYVSEDGSSCGALVAYRHSWFEGKFKLEVSLRETPSLAMITMPLKPQAYFKSLEFEPFEVPCLAFEELLAEKIRASSQRVRARDIYDLAKAAEKPLKFGLIKTLTVIKCWNVGWPFDPEDFLKRIRSGKYKWDDLQRLLRRGEKIDPEGIMSLCETRFQFLMRLSDDEKRLIGDARRRKLRSLAKSLLEESL